MTLAKRGKVQRDIVAFEVAGCVDDGNAIVQEGRVEVLFRRVELGQILDRAPTLAAPMRDEQVVLAATAVSVAGEHESLAVGRYDRRPFVASRVDGRAEILRLAVMPGALVERREVDIVLAEPAVAIGEEVNAGAIRRERWIEVVGRRIERHRARFAPAAGRTLALVDVPTAAFTPADRAPQHALAVRTERDANFGFRCRDLVGQPQLRGTHEQQGTSEGCGRNFAVHGASLLVESGRGPFDNVRQKARLLPD